MKVLIVNLSESFRGAIGVTVEGDKFALSIAHCLEAEHRTTKLTFHTGRIHSIFHIPNLQLLRSIRKAVFTHLIINSHIWIAEAHLSAYHFQATPCIDQNIVHIAFRSGGVSKRIMLQLDLHCLSIRRRDSRHPSAHFVCVGIGRRRSGGFNRISRLFHSVYRNLKTGRLEVTACQSRLHPTVLRGNHIGEIEIEILKFRVIHLVAKIGTTCAVKIVFIKFMHLIIKKLVNSHFCNARRCFCFTDAFTCAQSRDHEGVGIIIVWILLMDIGQFLRITFPAHGASTVKEDKVSVVELSVGLTRHINGDLHQIVGARNRIHLGQHAAAIVIDSDLARVDGRHINAQVRQVGISQFVDARFGKTDFIPIATSHSRSAGIVRIVVFRRKNRSQSHGKRSGKQFFHRSTHHTERNDTYGKQRLVTRAKRQRIHFKIRGV